MFFFLRPAQKQCANENCSLLIQLVCIIVPEEGDIAAFKNLTETDLGESSTAPGPVAAAPVPSAPPPSTSGTRKGYPDHTPGNTIKKKF